MNRRPGRPSRYWVLVAMLLAVAGCNDGQQQAAPDTSPDGLRNMASANEQEGTAASLDNEPNNSLERAALLPENQDTMQFRGVLTGGAQDRDVYLVPASLGPGPVQVSVTPVGGGDVLVGVTVRQGDLPTLFDNEVDGATETIPNVRVGASGTWITVTGRGTADIDYRLDLVKRSADVPTETEPNDQREQAQPIVVGTSVTAFVNRSGDVDRFDIQPATDALPLDIMVSPPGKRPLSVTLLATDTEVWQTIIEDGTPVTFRGLKPSAEGYTLVIEMVGEIDKPRVYQVALSQGTSEGLVELEPNDTVAEIQSLDVMGAPLAASIHQPSDIDWFRVVAPPNTTGTQVLTVEVQALGDVDLSLHVKLVEAGLEFARNDGVVGESEGICNLPLIGQTTAEIRVAPTEGTAPPADTAYSLLVNTRTIEGEELEPNDDGRLNPSVVTPGTPILGFLHPSQDVDVYRFSVPSVPGNLEARASTQIAIASGYKANLAFAIKDAQMADVARVDDTGFGEGESRKLDLPAGDYFIVVTSSSGASCAEPYSLTVALPEDWAKPATGLIPSVDDTEPVELPELPGGDDGDPPLTLDDEEPPLTLPTEDGGTDEDSF